MEEMKKFQVLGFPLPKIQPVMPTPGCFHVTIFAISMLPDVEP
jgi:hypothetical protein